MSGLQMSDAELAFVCQQFFGSDLVNWPYAPPTIGQIGQTNEKQYHPILQISVSVFYDVVPARFSKYGKSWQAGILNKDFKKDLTIWQIYELIKNDKFKARTEKLRTIKDEKKNRAYKRKHFSYACFSGIFSRRDADYLVKHSHLICIDLDHLPDVYTTREQIKREVDTAYFVMLFTSPNANGLKVIFHSEGINAETQNDWYMAFANYLGKLCHLPVKCIDTSCQNVSRACFLPCDPNIFLNHKLL